RRTLRGQNDALAMRCHDRQAATLEIEGDLVLLPVEQGFGMGMGQNRAVERAVDPRLQAAVQIAQKQHPVARPSPPIQPSFEFHLSRSYRSGFVAAEDVDAAEILD